MTFCIHVFDNENLTFSAEIAGVLEIGRQQAGEPHPFAMFRVGEKLRLVIAEQKYTQIAREQLEIKWQPDGTLRLTNISSSVPLRLRGAEPLHAKASRVLAMPVTVWLWMTKACPFVAVCGIGKWKARTRPGVGFASWSAPAKSM